MQSGLVTSSSPTWGLNLGWYIGLSNDLLNTIHNRTPTTKNQDHEVVYLISPSNIGNNVFVCQNMQSGLVISSIPTWGLNWGSYIGLRNDLLNTIHNQLQTATKYRMSKYHQGFYHGPTQNNKHMVYVDWCRNDKRRMQKNNTRDSNVVPHRSTNLARQCLTSLSRREAVLSLWYGRSWLDSKK